ncbi:DUF2857 domain-containing protein [Zophobihabitans entericus]|uniref:DUF2857 domain-containing protein n=1 Tax=Zophobihabitans entericus TaxID=1635327 RepID=A0A6G9IEK2_9GAMM|nr:DUF2857 domain-containing protein [Zophobihabitans entericus]QIQ22124.1 DUF2857 domain-containing protein [Zophobihabitans entericus]
MENNLINQAIIAQVLFCMNNGQLRRCMSLGFQEDDLKFLRDPEALSILMNTSVSWCKVSVDREVLFRLLQRAQDNEHEIEKIDKMLNLGASSKMISDVFGLNHREIAFRKRILGIDKKQGRWPEVTEEQDHLLWRKWQDIIKKDKLEITNQTDMAYSCMRVSEETNVAMAMIWQIMTEEWLNDNEKDDDD